MSLGLSPLGLDALGLGPDVAAAGAITGDLAATETGADSAALVGQVRIAGTLAAAESGADTAAVSGSVLVAGILAGLESGSDTAALTGQIIVRGVLAATETGSDTASIQGVGSLPTITGTLAAVESGSDTAAFAPPAARQPNSAPPVGRRLQVMARPVVASATRRMNTQAGRRPTFNGGTR